MNLGVVKTKTIKQNNAAESDNKTKVSKSNENLKTAIKRLSTNFKFEKRAFNKVVEDIKKSERQVSEHPTPKKVKSPNEDLKISMKSDSSPEQSKNDNINEEEKELSNSIRKSNFQRQNERLNRKISTRLDELFNNSLFTPLCTMGTNFRRKSPIAPAQGSDLKLHTYCETIHEDKRSERKDLNKSTEQKINRVSTLFNKSERK